MSVLPADRAFGAVFDHAFGAVFDHAFGAVLLTTALCFAGMAQAQSLQPVPLKPPVFTETPTQPAAAPQPLTPAIETTVETAPARPQHSTIQTEVLKAADPETFGTLDSASGGVSAEVWVGNSRARVERWLADVPATANRAMGDLTRRMLLTKAALPEGKAVGRNFLALRAERLFALGDAEGAGALMAAAGERLKDEAWRRIDVDRKLLAGDANGACALVPALMQGVASPEMQKNAIFCQIKAGDKTRATLGRDLLRDQGHDDPAFFALVDAMLGFKVAPPDRLADPLPVHLAMLRAIKKPAAADAAAMARPFMLSALAALADAPTDMRLRAAERAEAFGLIDADALASLIEGLGLSAKEAAQVAAKPATAKGAKARALLYIAAKAEEDALRRADLARGAFASAKNEGAGPTALRLFAHLLGDVAPAAEQAKAAPMIARSLLASGRVAGARAWVAALARAGTPESRAEAAKLLPLIALADPRKDEPVNPAMLKAWRQALAGAPEEISRQSVLLYSLLDAVGEDMDDVWRMVWEANRAHEPALLPAPALRQGLRSAADEGRMGEAVLMAQYILADARLAAEPAVLFEIVSQLRRIGLEAEARAVALEAALAAGL